MRSNPIPQTSPISDICRPGTDGSEVNYGELGRIGGLRLRLLLRSLKSVFSQTLDLVINNRDELPIARHRLNQHFVSIRTILEGRVLYE